MSNTYVGLKHPDINGGTIVQLYCTEVKVIYNKSNDKKPNANYSTSEVARVQSLSLENPKYILGGVKLSVGDLDFDKLVSFFKLANDESNPIILNVWYGGDPQTSTSIALKGFDGSTDIPVTFDGALNIPFNTKNSTGAYRPSFNINLVEVRTS